MTCCCEMSVMLPEVIINDRQLSQNISATRTISRCFESALVCRQLRDLTADDSLWKIQCKREYLLEECEVGRKWQSLFRSYHQRFECSPYCTSAIYREIRQLWNHLEAYLADNDKKMLDSLRDPACLDEIRIAEERMKCIFPPDLRCSLQIHNGQEVDTGNGLLGCMMISSYFRSEGLLDCASMARNYEDDGELPGCVPLTYCYISRKSQFITVSDIGGFQIGEIFYPTLDNISQNDTDQFITANSYKEWFTRIVHDLETNAFPRLQDKIFRFYHEPSCVAVTDGCFKVSASTCFMPDLSTIHPSHFFYIYRITMQMDADADKHLSCQLETRHWVITDDEGTEERVDGPGVVGEYPILTPGAEYSWISCTTFSTTYGNMTGHFTMKNLKTGDEVNIACPVFHMKCLPYKTGRERRQLLLERKKNL